MGKTDIKIDKISAYEDDFYGWCISVSAIQEDDEEVREIYFPRIQLPINRARIKTRFSYPCPGVSRCYVDLGFGELPVPGNNITAYTKKVIETKTKKMTLKEIEKKLGYKIELISEEENN